jgi:transposase
VEVPREVPDEEHERVWERVAAVDVAKGSGVVCTRVPDEDRPGRRRSHVWTVPARTGAITELGDHLRGLQAQVVTLESASDYWRIWYVILEAAGLKVQLASARTVKNVPGRAKTDLLTELADRSFGWCVRNPAMLARFRPHDQRRGYAAGVVRAGGAAARFA